MMLVEFVKLNFLLLLLAMRYLNIRPAHLTLNQIKDGD